jgi:hypothetical protein
MPAFFGFDLRWRDTTAAVRFVWEGERLLLKKIYTGEKEVVNEHGAVCDSKP